MSRPLYCTFPVFPLPLLLYSPHFGHDACYRFKFSVLDTHPQKARVHRAERLLHNQSDEVRRDAPAALYSCVESPYVIMTAQLRADCMRADPAGTAASNMTARNKHADHYFLAASQTTSTTTMSNISSRSTRRPARARQCQYPAAATNACSISRTTCPPSSRTNTPGLTSLCGASLERFSAD